MSKIEMMEVNQHTSDEVAKVLADLEAHGVDIAAVGANIEAIKTAMASGGGLKIKSIQNGTISIGGTEDAKSATISSVDKNKAVVLYCGVKVGDSSTSSSSATVRAVAGSNCGLWLASNTSVQAARGYPFGLLVVYFTVIEFS